MRRPVRSVIRTVNFSSSAASADCADRAPTCASAKAASASASRALGHAMMSESVGGTMQFGLGMLGVAPVAVIVSSLAGVWGLADVFDWKHSLNECLSRRTTKFLALSAVKCRCCSMCSH